MKNIKRLNIILILIMAISMICANNVFAIGEAFSGADDFLSKRKFNIFNNK